MWCGGKENEILIDNLCLTLYKEELSWEEAKDYCEKQGASLPILNTTQLQSLKKDSKFLQGMQVWMPDTTYEIGRTLKDIRTSWVGTNVTVDWSPINFENLEEEASTRWISGPKCVAIQKLNEEYYLIKKHCSEKALYTLCMDTNKGNPSTPCTSSMDTFWDGRCYRLHIAFLSWDETNQYICGYPESRLATITSKEQMKAVLSFLSDNEMDYATVWVGGKMSLSSRFNWIANNQAIDWSSELWFRGNEKVYRSMCIFLKKDTLATTSCTSSGNVICMTSISSDSMIIESFYDDGKSKEEVIRRDIGESLLLRCTAETHSLPRKITIRHEGNITTHPQRDTHSVELMIQNVNCKDIGKYTCELEDITRRMIEKRDVFVAVNKCPPQSCGQTIKSYHVIPNQDNTVSFTTCIRSSNWTDWSIRAVYHYRFGARKLVPYLEKVNTKPLNFRFANLYNYFHNTILKVTWEDIGNFEFQIHFYSGYVVGHNLTVTADDCYFLNIRWPCAMWIRAFGN